MNRYCAICGKSINPNLCIRCDYCEDCENEMKLQDEIIRDFNAEHPAPAPLPNPINPLASHAQIQSFVERFNR